MDIFLLPGKGGEIALEELPPLVIGSTVLKELATRLLEAV